MVKIGAKGFVYSTISKPKIQPIIENQPELLHFAMLIAN